MIYKIENGVIIFGPLYNCYSNGNIRIWKLIIELYNDKDAKCNIYEDAKIFNEYYTGYYTITGLINGTLTTSAKTIITTGKNIGKKNETNILEQAINEGTSKYKYKINMGYSLTQTVNTEKESIIPFPMALHKYANHKNKLIYPLYVQPKLDGLRMLVKLHNNKIIMMTRRHHIVIGFNDIEKELFQILTNNKNIILDGELYNHNMPLQEISGIVRNEDTINKNKLQFWVFDCFSLNSKIGFHDRYKILNDIINTDLNYIKLTETILINSEDEGDNYFDSKIVDKYEGSIYKSYNKPYNYSFEREKRSMYYLKRKAIEDSEYKIVGFKNGNGKDINCVIFILETSDNKKFNSVPNGTYEYRKELYNDCIKNFKKKYLNKIVKVQYEDLSKNGIPLRNKMIGFRDPNFD
jgi:DNA ligase-1